MKNELQKRFSLKSLAEFGMGKLLPSCLFLALTAVSSVASASMIASENFDNYDIGALAGKSGGTGWSTAWITSSAPVVTVVDPAIDLQGNRAIAFAGNSNFAASRTFSTTLSDDVLVDFQIQFKGTLNNNDFLGLWFGTDWNGPNIGLKGNLGTGAGVNDFFVRTNGSAGNWLAGSDITSTTTYHIFGHLYKTPEGNGTYNRFDAWLNPTDTEISSLTGWDASYSGNSSISSFNSIGFRTANVDSGDTVLIDNLNIQTAPVPEPGTIILLGVGMLGLAVYGKRRMNKEA